MHWGFLYISLASLLASLSSVALSKTVYKGASIGGYLFFYFFTGFLICSCTNGLSLFNTPCSLPMMLLGFVAGALISGMMFTMGKALQNGPSGLTFAFQNSGAILPPLVMALIFSAPFGFALSIGNWIGLGLVIVGLFWGAARQSKTAISKAWIVYAVLCFALQGLILSIFQWRSLFLIEGLPEHVLIPFSLEMNDDIWFTPALFFAAWLYQAIRVLLKKNPPLQRVEAIGGGLGGVANGLSTFFLLQATVVATSVEKVMLFPLFTILIITLCNVYGKILYREAFHWQANVVAALGILIGTLL